VEKPEWRKAAKFWMRLEVTIPSGPFNSAETARHGPKPRKKLASNQSINSFSLPQELWIINELLAQDDAVAIDGARLGNGRAELA
jgi:hypothetical protein